MNRSMSRSKFVWMAKSTPAEPDIHGRRPLARIRGSAQLRSIDSCTQTKLAALSVTVKNNVNLNSTNNNVLNRTA